MAKQIINLTELLITKGIDLVLRAYPRYPHQVAFQDSDAFEHLTRYVLQRVQAIYNCDRPKSARSATQSGHSGRP